LRQPVAARFGICLCDARILHVRNAGSRSLGRALARPRFSSAENTIIPAARSTAAILGRASGRRTTPPRSPTRQGGNMLGSRSRRPV
jgi:hypothetical protein